MTKLKKQKNIPVGSQSVDYRKTGAGALPSDPATTPIGAALTWVANGIVGLAGLNNKICGFFRLYDKGADKISMWDESAGELAAIPANGTITPGANVVGYSDSDRGKVKEATLTFATPATPTVQELKTAVEIVQNAKWECTRSASGSCSLKPSA